MKLLTPILTILASVAITLAAVKFFVKPPAANVASIDVGREFVQAAERSKAAVVFIASDLDGVVETTNDVKSGSGVLVTQDGFIVTNDHVVSGAKYLQVMLDNQQVYDARLMGADSTQDIALLKINVTGLPFLPLANSDSVRLAERILAIGTPYQLTNTVTSGIVSAVNREVRLHNNVSRSFIQIDAPTNTGSSGGAVVNVHGELIGIPVAIMSMSGVPEGFSIIIPSNRVARIVQDIIEHGALVKGSLGMSIRKVTPEIAQQSNMTEAHGIVVEVLEANGAADMAGIRSLDVITHVNGQKILSTVDFQEKWRSYYPGDTLQLAVNRLGKIEKVSMVIQKAK